LLLFDKGIKNSDKWKKFVLIFSGKSISKILGKADFLLVSDKLGQSRKYQ
jgi:hypothetical protein